MNLDSKAPSNALFGMLSFPTITGQIQLFLETFKLCPSLSPQWLLWKKYSILICLHFRRQCDKRNKHIQRPGKMTSPTSGVGSLSPKLKRDWKAAAVRKQQVPVPEIPSLSCSNCQKIRTHNSHTHLWLRLRNNRQTGKNTALCRQTMLLL